MKIIGGHDYYDGAGMGVDETILFLRKEQEVWDTPFDLPHRPDRFRRYDLNLDFHYVLVAGKVYPAISQYIPGDWGAYAHGKQAYVASHTIWHYEPEAVKAIVKNYTEEHAAARIPFGMLRDLPGQIDEHFRETERQAWTRWMIENKVVTGLVSWEYRNKDLEGTFARTNISDLKDIEFFRVLDPATIHMEISNYIGGVLPSSPDTVEISDKDRIRKAGFDKKSFRQDPGVKKPRRRRQSV